jgi:hypothetical protein
MCPHTTSAAKSCEMPIVESAAAAVVQHIGKPR